MDKDKRLDRLAAQLVDRILVDLQLDEAKRIGLIKSHLDLTNGKWTLFAVGKSLPILLR